MPNVSKKAAELKGYILQNISGHPKNIANITAKQFGITRQTATVHLRNLVQEGLLTAQGATKARRYELRLLIDEVFRTEVSPELEEDMVWRERVRPLLGDIPQNVADICQYGFTEMLNNVRDHSGSADVLISVWRDAIKVGIQVVDHGVGIFNKIQRDFHLNDPRHALLELSKGKLTSDETAHTGEGIFFTSRMFDSFSILSGTLFFIRTNTRDQWLIEVEDRGLTEGTFISMEIAISAQHTTQSVFDRYADERQDFGFRRTHVPVKLAKYPTEQLVSRSQARRVLARFERFDEVMLDFEGVDNVGPAFADEIFRVYKLEHPDTALIPINMTPEVRSTVERVTREPVLPSS